MQVSREKAVSPDSPFITEAVPFASGTTPDKSNPWKRGIMEQNELSRRGFLKGFGALAAGAAAVSVVGCKKEEPAPAVDPIQWTDEADVVVIGSGAAGFSTASWYLIKNPEGSVILVETATEELSGGNSRVCGQGILGGDTWEAVFEYVNAMNEPYVVDKDIMEEYAKHIYNNNEILNQYYDGQIQVSGGSNWDMLPGQDKIRQFNEKGVAGDQAAWKLLRDKALELGTKVYYETRAVELLKNDAGEIIGIKSEDGRLFKGKRAVVLACGGFEASQEMIDCYRPIGMEFTKPRGTWTNVGDGIKMAMAVGANLWHMNSFSGGGWGIKGLDKDNFNAVIPIRLPATKGYIFVSHEAKRFQYEENNGKHGKQMRGCKWYETDVPGPCYLLMDDEAFQSKLFSTSSWVGRNEYFKPVKSNQDLVDRGIVVKCENYADIAKAYNLSEEYLKDTIETYNFYAAQNYDPIFNRGKAITNEGTLAIAGVHPMSGLSAKYTDNSTAIGKAGTATTKAEGDFDLKVLEFPLYVCDLVPCILNTFGGPQRGLHGTVIGLDGKPIPRLYEAGELGSVYTNRYNGGSAFGEAISSGRIAAEAIVDLAPWDEEAPTTA